jgi:hypothetical protein
MSQHDLPEVLVNFFGNPCEQLLSRSLRKGWAEMLMKSTNNSFCEHVVKIMAHCFWRSLCACGILLETFWMISLCWFSHDVRGPYQNSIDSDIRKKKNRNNYSVSIAAYACMLVVVLAPDVGNFWSMSIENSMNHKHLCSMPHDSRHV